MNGIRRLAVLRSKCRVCGIWDYRKQLYVESLSLQHRLT